MSKPVKSTDVRKPIIVASLKLVSGGNKVTNVVEEKDGTFNGACMLFNKKTGVYDFLGTFSTPAIAEIFKPNKTACVAVNALAEES